MLDILIGLQWGDEGKGKVVDVLTANYDIIARFQGGPNAGHTLKIGDFQFILHLVPSGIFRENTINVIGNGVIIDPVTLENEIKELQKVIPDVKKRLLISNKAHLILPTHRLLDAAYEKAKGKKKIGSTLRGIGPTYSDKTARFGIRVGDIFNPDFEAILAEKITYHLRILEFLNYEDFDINQLLDKWTEAIEFLKDLNITNTEYYLNEQINNGMKILAEGAQGVMLDIDFGTYPYVTSSNTIAAAATIGLGIPPKKINQIYGVFKAYTTRVGNGPFPTELSDQLGKKLREQGNEYGATTGRPRRTGWLDLVILKYATMITGVDKLIMTKADVLNGFEKIKVATKYLVNNQITTQLPYNLEQVSPIYEELDGWDKICLDDNFQNLAPQFKKYLDFIQNYLQKPITGVSFGPRRRDILWLKNN